MIKLSVALQTPEVQGVVPVALLSGTFEERSAKAAALGYNGVGLMTADPAALDMVRLRSAIKHSGLAVAAIGSGAMTTGLTLLNPDPEKAARAQARLEELLTFAANIGAPVATVGSLRGWLGRQGSFSYADLVQTVRT